VKTGFNTQRSNGEQAWLFSVLMQKKNK